MYTHINAICKLLICSTVWNASSTEGIRGGSGPHSNHQPSLSPKIPNTLKHLERHVKILSRTLDRPRVPHWSVPHWSNIDLIMRSQSYMCLNDKKWETAIWLNETRTLPDPHKIDITFKFDTVFYVFACNSSGSRENEGFSHHAYVFIDVLCIYAIFQLFICMLSCMKWGRPKGIKGGPGPHCDSQPSSSPKNPKTTKHVEYNVKMLSKNPGRPKAPYRSTSKLWGAIFTLFKRLWKNTAIWLDNKHKHYEIPTK